MIRRRPSEERGHADHGWLDTYHTFSFASYQDFEHMGFRALRVINEDWVQPGRGFGTHPHRDMEIITYVLEGALAHKDSMGNSSTINAGDVQRMTAGTGIMHSELNASESEAVHLLQIWILPSSKGLRPSYEERSIAPTEKHGKLCLIASPEPDGAVLKVHQDVALYVSQLDAGAEVGHEMKPGRHAWLQMIHGAVTLNSVSLAAGDGAAVDEVTRLEITASKDTEFLLFDLA